MTDTKDVVTKWIEVAIRGDASLKKNGPQKKARTLEAKTKIIPGTFVYWYKQSHGEENTKYTKACHCV